MPIIIIDKTSLSPVEANSRGFTAYNDLGRIPCFDCDTIAECEDCPADQAYKNPLEDTDLIYLQYNVDDTVNQDPTNPEFGWHNTGLVWFVKATIEFAQSAPLLVYLNDGTGIVYSASVGYDKFSFQNLVLSARNILLHIQSLGRPTDCFRIHIETQAATDSGHEFSDNLFAALPAPDGYLPGTTAVVNGLSYIIDNDGAWETVAAVPDGSIYWILSYGGFWEYSGGLWGPTTPSLAIAEGAECFSGWYEYITCGRTVLIEGVHGLYDCRNKYYAAVDTEYQQGIAYRDQFRLEAEFLLVGFPTERTKNDDGISLTFVQKEEYSLTALRSVPEVVARRVANVLVASNIFINSGEYSNPSDLSKNNDQGAFWFPIIKLERIACESPNNCDGIIIYNPNLLPSLADCPECPPTNPASYNVHYLTAGVIQSGNVLCGGSLDVSVPDPIVCANGTVENSDASYTNTVTSGGLLVLPDTDVRVYIDGILNQSFTIITLANVEINIAL